MSRTLLNKKDSIENSSRRSKRSKTNSLTQQSNKAFSFYFDLQQEKLESNESIDEIVTKALALGGEIVEESSDADFIIANHENGVYEEGGMLLSEKFIEESYSNGGWIADVTSYLLTFGESSKKKQKKTKYSDDEIRNLVNYVYQHNNQSLENVEREVFENMSLLPEFEGRSAQGLERKFSQLGKNTLKKFLNTEQDDHSKNTTPSEPNSSILDSLIASISETETPPTVIEPVSNPTIETETQPIVSSPKTSIPTFIEQIPEKNKHQEDQILLELKSELTKDQIFSFMCEIIGFPIENRIV